MSGMCLDKYNDGNQKALKILIEELIHFLDIHLNYAC